MAAKKLRKFPSFMIYLYSKESAFKAVKREGKICDRGTYTTCLWKVYKKAEVRNFDFKQRGTRFRIISMNVTLRKYMVVLVRCENWKILIASKNQDQARKLLNFLPMSARKKMFDLSTSCLHYP